MGLFSKKENKKDESIPKLPELPSLPNSFPDIDEDYNSKEVHQLPSFPNSSMGDKFSQETIKNAVSGEEEDENEESNEMHKPVIPKPDFEMERLPRPTYAGEKEIDYPKKVQRRNIEEKTPKETGPVFIRIDKFEEALEIFKETKDKIEEIESLLDETKELKEKEEEELSTWEKEIQDMKNQIEKVDRDIFSRI